MAHGNSAEGTQTTAATSAATSIFNRTEVEPPHPLGFLEGSCQLTLGDDLG